MRYSFIVCSIGFGEERIIAISIFLLNINCELYLYIISVKYIYASRVPNTNPDNPNIYIFSRAALIGHFCNCWAFHFLLNWLPSFFHDRYPEAKV